MWLMQHKFLCTHTHSIWTKPKWICYRYTIVELLNSPFFSLVRSIDRLVSFWVHDVYEYLCIAHYLLAYRLIVCFVLYFIAILLQQFTRFNTRRDHSELNVIYMMRMLWWKDFIPIRIFNVNRNVYICIIA